MGFLHLVGGDENYGEEKEIPDSVCSQEQSKSKRNFKPVPSLSFLAFQSHLVSLPFFILSLTHHANPTSH